MLASTATTLDELKRKAIRPDGPFGDHLRWLAGLLLIKPKPLRNAALQILQGKPCNDEAGFVVGASRQEARMPFYIALIFFRIPLETKLIHVYATYARERRQADDFAAERRASPA